MHSADLSTERLHGELRISARRAAAARSVRESQQKDMFIATVAHELRNMMAPLGSALDLIDLGREAALARALVVARRQVKHMSYLVEELLDVARVVNNQVLLTRHEFQLGTVLAEAVEACEPMFLQRQQRLVVDLTGEKTPLLGDPVRWAQIAMNLLHNASKFTPEGGTVQVQLQVLEEEHQAVLRVSDTGRGIPKAELEKIFDMFRCEKRVSEPGLGIGLALVRRLVELHGGTIHAESAGRNRGATFVVRVPLLVPHSLPTSQIRVRMR